MADLRLMIMPDTGPELGEYRVFRETNSLTGRRRWRLYQWVDAWNPGDPRYWGASSEPIYFRWLAESRARRWNLDRSWVRDA